MSSIYKTGIVLSNNFVEENQFNKATSIYKQLNSNLVPGRIEVYTNKNGAISSVNTLSFIPGATIKSLAGQTLCCSYEVACLGARYSAEQGQTAWQYTRYGIHGGITIDGSTNYPFADNLNYSGGPKKVVMTWTIPTGKTNYGDLTVSVQLFDKPASTNNEVWYIKDYKIEVAGYNTPYINKDYSGTGDVLSSKEIIEI